MRVSLSADEVKTRLEELALRIIARPESTFGMSGVALFAEDMWQNRISVIAGTDTDHRPLSNQSTFCLASVGKLAIALLVLQLVDEGKVSLDTTLGEANELITGDVRNATLRDALSHRGNIPPILSEELVPYSASLLSEDIRNACRTLDRVPDSGRQIRYSDVAYGLLADVVEHCSALPLSECLSGLNRMLGTRLTIGLPPREGYVRVADIPGSYSHTTIAPLNSAFWHSLSLPWIAICGAPDDGLRLIGAFAERRSLLSPQLRETAISDPDDGMLCGGIPSSTGYLGIGPSPLLTWSPCGWALGVELRGDKSPHWTPKEAHTSSFGHVGISGTLAWHDPTVGVSWAMAGTRCSHSGWLLRYGPMLGSAVLRSVIRETAV